MGAREVITHKQVLAEMAAAVEPFSLVFVKLNEGRGTGGEVVALSGQLLSGRGSSTPTPDPTPKERGEEEAAPRQVRKPNHQDNFTRNLVSTLNGNFTKVHYPLILEFNGKKAIP